MLLTLAESGSMTVTAKKLNVTQPALTYQLKNIESELGFKVFNRSRTGSSLTPEGKFFCDELSHVLVQYNEAVRLSRALARKQAPQEIRIGTTGTSRDFATLLLNLGADEMPHLAFSTIPCGASDPLSLLRGGVLDFWSCSDSVLQASAQTQLQFEKLFDAPLIAHVHRESPLAEKQHINLADLEGCTVQLLPTGCGSRASDSLRGTIATQKLDIAIRDLPLNMPPMVAELDASTVAIYDEGFLAPSPRFAASIPLDFDVQDSIGFAYLQDNAERLQPALRIIREFYQNHKQMRITEETSEASRIITVLDETAQAVRTGSIERVEQLVDYALKLGVPANQIFDRGLAAGMYAMNEDLREGAEFTADMIASIGAMDKGCELLEDQMSDDFSSHQLGTAVIGTLEGDAHTIGKNQVRMMLMSRGIEVADLGSNANPAAFVEHIRENKQCNLVLISVFDSTIRPNVLDVISALEEAKLRERVFIMIGGAGVDEAFAQEIGADAYTASATEAAQTALQLISY